MDIFQEMIGINIGQVFCQAIYISMSFVICLLFIISQEFTIFGLNICIWHSLEREMGLSQHKCLNPA